MKETTKTLIAACIGLEVLQAVYYAMEGKAGLASFASGAAAFVFVFYLGQK